MGAEAKRAEEEEDREYEPQKLTFILYIPTRRSCDSIEHVDYSICTLEFETRRENYFWLLQQKGIFRPKVFEMSRLNIEVSQRSERALMKTRILPMNPAKWLQT